MTVSRTHKRRRKPIPEPTPITLPPDDYEPTDAEL